MTKLIKANKKTLTALFTSLFVNILACLELMENFEASEFAQTIIIIVHILAQIGMTMGITGRGWETFAEFSKRLKK